MIRTTLRPIACLVFSTMAVVSMVATGISAQPQLPKVPQPPSVPQPPTPTIPQPPAAPQPTAGVLKRAAGGGKFETFRDPSGRFSIDYPAKGWRVIPAGGSLLVGFTSRDGDASVLVDYTKLQISLAPSEIDAMFADLEVELLKERQPSASDVKPRLAAGPSGTRVVIEFSQPGARGTDHVVQYSSPIGADLYRMVCIVRADRAAKNQPALSHMVESFAVAPRSR